MKVIPLNVLDAAILEMLERQITANPDDPELKRLYACVHSAIHFKNLPIERQEAVEAELDAIHKVNE